jgi:hypothetical protein
MHRAGIARRVTLFDSEIASLNPAKLIEFANERVQAVAVDRFGRPPKVAK